ncbi:MAG: hypothetical protein ACTSRS_04040 [Candidatus Helarchaeota archaeon]
MARSLSAEEREALKDIKIGKWDIISEYHRIDWLKKGHTEDEAKIHGIVIAIVGYRARLGKKPLAYKIEKKGGERGVSIEHRKKERWITPKEFDKIIKKMGEKYYQKIFSPAIENLYDQGLSYKEVKEVVGIPSKIGAKIALDRFLEFLPKEKAA